MELRSGLKRTTFLAYSRNLRTEEIEVLDRSWRINTQEKQIIPFSLVLPRGKPQDT